MLSNYKLFKRFVFILIIPVLFFTLLAYCSYVLLPLPNVSPLHFKNASYEFRSLRDENGIVFIDGKSEKDVYFATGYAHAQDRLWQLELQRRISRGTLSEVFGESSLQEDIFMRRLGIFKSAQDAEKYLSKEALLSLDSYADGINEWLKQKKSLPLEFSILGIEPEPWTRTDSLAWSKVFALSLSSNFRDELRKFEVLQGSEKSFVKDFFDLTPKQVRRNAEPLQSSNLASVLNVIDKLSEQYQVGGENVGSNAWAVSGKHTSTGNPIIAGDPHLGISMPSLWYAVSQKGGRLEAKGMTIVGLPIIIFGKNKNIAWAGTSMMADVQDLYIETINPKDPRTYKDNGKWTNFVVRDEKIKVKARFPAMLRDEIKPVNILIRETIRGPVISDSSNHNDGVISLRWTALDLGDSSYEAFFKLGYSENWLDFNNALMNLRAPALNFIYADVKGNIAFQSAGRIPIRTSGIGDTPTLGEDMENHWKGFIEYSKLPRKFNPEDGMIVSANENFVDDNYPYFISSNFAEPYRAKRIKELILKKISNNDKINVKNMMEMQSDVKDLSVEKMHKVLVKFIENNNIDSNKISELVKWDMNANEDSIAPLLYYNWVRNIKNLLLDDDLNRYVKTSGKHFSPEDFITDDHLAVLLTSNTHLCDVLGTIKQESCNDIVLASYSNFLADLRLMGHSDLDEVTWGDVNLVLYKHTPFSEINIVKNLFERKFRSGGAKNTVNVVSSNFFRKKGYISRFGASFRGIIDVSENDSSYYIMNSTGQSGQVGSINYDDMTEMFREEKYILFSQKSIN